MRFEIYFPSKDKDGKDLDTYKRLGIFYKVDQRLIKDFGGYTKFMVTGTSVINGKTIDEDIVILLVYANEVTETYLRKLVEPIKNELNQASVMYTINDRAYFV